MQLQLPMMQTESREKTSSPTPRALNHSRFRRGILTYTEQIHGTVLKQKSTMASSIPQNAPQPKLLQLSLKPKHFHQNYPVGLRSFFLSQKRTGVGARPTTGPHPFWLLAFRFFFFFLLRPHPDVLHHIHGRCQDLIADRQPDHVGTGIDHGAASTAAKPATSA